MSRSSSDEVAMLSRLASSMTMSSSGSHCISHGWFSACSTAQRGAARGSSAQHRPSDTPKHMTLDLRTGPHSAGQQHMVASGGGASTHHHPHLSHGHALVVVPVQAGVQEVDALLAHFLPGAVVHGDGGLGHQHSHLVKLGMPAGHERKGQQEQHSTTTALNSQTLQKGKVAEAEQAMLVLPSGVCQLQTAHVPTPRTHMPSTATSTTSTTPPKELDLDMPVCLLTPPCFTPPVSTHKPTVHTHLHSSYVFQ